MQGKPFVWGFFPSPLMGWGYHVMHPECVCALDGPPACATVGTTYVTAHGSYLGLLTAVWILFL